MATDVNEQLDPQADATGVAPAGRTVGSSVRSWLKWLYPGMRVKRWLLLIPIGLALIIVGVGVLTNLRTFDYMRMLDDLAREVFLRFGVELNLPRVYVPIAGLFIVLGSGLIFICVRQVVGSVTSVVAPAAKGKLADVVFQKRYLEQGQKIVVIGGGTGLSTLLRGLKEHTGNIVAVVTVTDEGGSSGELRRQFGMLPPGDIRNCIAALADDEQFMTRLLQYRFDSESEGLRGHTVGNLLLLAMTRLTGDFDRAIKETSRVLAIRGRVLPSTLQDVKVIAEMDSGDLVEGETAITSHPDQIKSVYLKPSDAKPVDEALRAIEEADAIVIGPGSVYTSIVPNLLVRGVSEAIARSSALKVYVCNVMTQPGETAGYSAADHIRGIVRHTQERIFDYVIVNNTVPPESVLMRYREQGAELVRPDMDEIKKMGYVPVVAPLANATELVRHDPRLLAEAIVGLVFQRG